jgi:shikimate dehydrogenase
LIRLLVVGDPIAHSLSPAIHTAALRHFEIDGVYDAERVSRGNLARIIERIRTGELTGANVTMPLKQEAASLCDRLTVEAHRTGAVNTLLLSGGEVVGANTDVRGIRDAWVGGNLPPGPALILGAGGAASAALVALEGAPLSVAARSLEASKEVVARTGVAAQVTAWGSDGVGRVVVNSTPLGMKGEELPTGLVESATGLFDMTYRSGLTPAVAAAKALGLPVVDGKEMLVCQAIRSFELWTGLLPPRGVMQAAVHS